MLNNTGIDIKQPNGQYHLLKKRGNTNDIIRSVLSVDAYGVSYVSDFAKSLQGSDDLETYENIFNFLKTNIPYAEDIDGRQDIQSPGELYNNRYTSLGGTGRGGDCKSFSLFVSSVLRALGNYNFKYRFVSEDRDSDFHHVYIIASYEGKYVTIDATLKEFNREVRFVKKRDESPAKATAKVSISGTKRIGDTTQAAADINYWQKEVDYMKNNIFQIRAKCEYDTLTGIAFANGSTKPDPTCRHATKRLKCSLSYTMVTKNWNDLIKFSSCLIYHYWNDPSFMAYSLCRRDNETSAPVPFPQGILIKKATSTEFYLSLKKVGMRDADIQQMANIGVFHLYGITLDYMLYRCYCMELYGQPFRPRTGIPYYDVKDGFLHQNGASIDDFVSIGLCLPVQGGFGRPWGTPYYAKSGWIISNGASETDINNWVRRNPPPGTILPDGSVVPGYTFPPWGTVTKEQQDKHLKAYDKWRAGNMVVLSTTVNKSTTDRPGANMGMPKIGADIAAIVGAVVAIVAAVASIAAIIAKIINESKKDKGASSIPIPPEDFKWEYNTVDGGYIALCGNPSGCAGGVGFGSHIKVNADGTIDNNPDLSAPQNQSPENNFGGDKPMEMSMGKKIITGFLLATGAYLLLSDSPKTKAA